MEQALDRRLFRLEWRVSRLERRAGLSDAAAWVEEPHEASPPSPPPKLATPPAPVRHDPVVEIGLTSVMETNVADDADSTVPPLELEPIAKSEVSMPLPPIAVSRPIPTIHPIPMATAVFPKGQVPHVTPVTPPPMPYQRVPAPKGPVTQTQFEQEIGLKWAGWIGAIVLVIGVGLGVKYAYDQNWLDAIPGAIRLLLMSLGGVALLCAGEWVYRRVNTLAAVGLYGAGVATLFIVAYAGQAYYDLYSRDVAFALMIVSTLVGAGVAMRGKLVSIAVLSLIGGNLAPILISNNEPRMGALLTYLLMLQVIALFLAWWGASAKWWTLRGLSLTAKSLWIATLVIENGRLGGPQLPLLFCVLFASLYHAELIVSTLFPRRAQRSVRAGGKGGQGFALIVTSLFTLGMLCLLQDRSDAVRGLSVLAEAGVCAAAGFLLSGSALTRALAIGYRIQAAVLIVIAVPVGLTGGNVVLGWSALAVAFALLGRMLDLTLSRRASVIVWALGGVYLIGWTNGPFGDSYASHRTLFELAGTMVPAYAGFALLLAIAGHLVGMILQLAPRPKVEGPVPPPVIASATDGLPWVTHIGAALTIFVAAIAALPPVGATLSFIAYAWALLLIDVLAPRSRMFGLALGVVAVACVKWALVDLLADRLSPGWSATRHMPLLNPAMATGLVIAGTMVAFYWLRRHALVEMLQSNRDGEGERSGVSTATLLVSGLVLFVITLGLTFEIDRVVERALALGTAASAESLQQVRQLSFTMLWLASAMAWLGISRFILKGSPARDASAVHYSGAIVVLLTIKYLLVDLLAMRMDGGPAPWMVLFNLQTLAALVVLGALILIARADRAVHATTGQSCVLATMAMLGISVVLFACGTAEIDRAFSTPTIFRSQVGSPYRAMQVGFSIFWSIFAVVHVMIGFRIRAAWLRYVGLTLLGVTLLKVVVLDMHEVQTGYRILSFLGLGLLMLGTSVLYGKLSPKLTESPQESI